MMMKNLVILVLFGACGAVPMGAEDPPASVREHLEAPTHLRAATGTSGAITAKRWSPTVHDWVGADVPIVITNGGIDAQVDGSGRLSLDSLQLALAPIDIPEGAIGTAARLEHLRIDAMAPIAASSTTWSGDDVAVAAVPLDLKLSWAITIDDVTSELGPLHVPALVGNLDIGGSGKTVDIDVAFDLEGTVWSWLGIIELSDLHISVETKSD